MAYGSIVRKKHAKKIALEGLRLKELGNCYS